MPKCPNVSGLFREPVQWGDFSPRTSKPSPQSQGSNRPYPGSTPRRPGKATLVAGVSGGALGRIKAGELLADVAGHINGKAGGRPDMAQGGGDDGSQLVAALAAVPTWVKEHLREP